MFIVWTIFYVSWRVNPVWLILIIDSLTEGETPIAATRQRPSQKASSFG
jgi:hypothetical protein